MSHNEQLDDSTLTQELRDSLSELATPERPSLAEITGRGRAHRRRRLAGLAGSGVAGVAAGTALALGLTGVLGTATARSTGTTGAGAAARSTGTIRTAAFTLTSNANGTDTLTLTTSQVLDPAALQQALTQHGIRALVKTGTYCWSSPAAPDPASIGVLSVRPSISWPPIKAHGLVPAPAGSAPGKLEQIVARTVTVINAAAMPSGTELFFGYSSSARVLFANLIYTSSYTCSNSYSPPPTR